jgi:polyisoprenoid-binding protein YceI
MIVQAGLRSRIRREIREARVGDYGAVVQMPAKGTWKLDPNHTVIGAVARHLMVTKVRGRFTSFEGAVHIGDSPEESWAELEIDAASIDTGVEQRDQHLRSADFLDVEHHPKISFKSTNVERKSEDTLRVTGDLSIRGIARAVTLDVTFEGVSPDPWGGTRAGFTISGVLHREDWDMNWNVALETGGVLVSKSVDLEIEAQAVKEPETEGADETETKAQGDATS